VFTDLARSITLILNRQLSLVSVTSTPLYPAIATHGGKLQDTSIVRGY